MSFRSKALWRTKFRNDSRTGREISPSNALTLTPQQPHGLAGAVVAELGWNVDTKKPAVGGEGVTSTFARLRNGR